MKHKNEELQRTEKETVIHRTLPGAAFKASLENDWSGVSQKDRTEFIAAMCDALSVPLPLNPFRFMKLKGRDCFYCPADGFFVLARFNHLSTTLLSKEYDTSTQLYTVTVRADQKKGDLHADNYAVVYLGGLAGKDRANEMMKAITKAQRRAIKAAIGISVMDDDERTALSKNSEPVTRDEVEAPRFVETINQEEEEDQDARKALFDELVGSGGLFPKNPKAAMNWISEKGQAFESLKAADVEELLAAIREEKGEGQEHLDDLLPPLELPLSAHRDEG